MKVFLMARDDTDNEKTCFVFSEYEHGLKIDFRIIGLFDMSQ